MRPFFLRYAALHGFYWSLSCSAFSFVAVYLLARGLNNTQVGLVLVVSNLAAVVLQQPLAALADRSNKVTLPQLIFLLSGLLLPFFLLLIFLHMPVFYIGLVYVLICSIELMLQSFVNALGMECENRGIPVNFGLCRGFGSLVNAVATWALGYLIMVHGVNMLMFGSILFSVLMMVVMRGFILPPLDQSKWGERTARLSLFSFFRRYPLFLLVSFGVMLTFYCFTITMTYLVHFMDRLDGNSAELGFALGLASLLEVPTMCAFSRIVKRIPVSALMKISSLFMLINAIAICLAPSVPVIYLCQIFYVAGFALFPPSSVYYTNACMAPEDRVQGQAIMVATTMIACAFASLLGGWMIDSYGIMVAAWWGNGISALGVLIVFGAVKRLPAEKEDA